MTKQELIRNLKYTKEKHKNDHVDTNGTNIVLMCEDVLNFLEKCIEIPDNATNGDIIKLLFPNKEEFNAGKGMYFNAYWWVSPYKNEVEDE